MIRIAALIIAIGCTLPVWAQDVRHLPAVGSSAAEGRALLEPICERFVFAEEKYLTCTWDSTSEVITASYTNKGRLYYMQWLPVPIDAPKSSIVDSVVAVLGFSGLSRPCDFAGDKVPC